MNMNIARIEDEDEIPPEAMFEDEEMEPTPAPSQRSGISRQFDPFAPVGTPATPTTPPNVATAIPLDELYNSTHGSTNKDRDEDEEMEDTFEDEDEAEHEGASAAASSEKKKTKKNSSRSVNDGPVLIPMNPDADAELLGSIARKHASKAKKDPKIKDITYRDGDGDLLMLGADPKKEETESSKTDEADEFVDDEAAASSSGGGGLFSRLRNKIAAATTTPKAASKGDGAKSEAAADVTPPPASMFALQDGGNSLPHPDSVMRGHTRDLIRGEDPDDEAALDENGNSLPHPDEIVRSKGDARKTTADQNLDANGNSLPHPDEMNRLVVGTTTGTTAEEDTLDANGNSLPHPDTLMGAEDRLLLNDVLNSTNTRDSDSTESSSRSNDAERLRLVLENESVESDDEDYYNVHTDDSDDEGYDDEGLESKGRSLPPPSAESLAPPSEGVPSLRWGNFRMSLNSTFSKPSKSKSGVKASEEANFDSDQESFQDEEQQGRPPSSDRDLLDLVNNDELAFDENGIPLNASEGNFNDEKKQFSLAAVGQSVMMALRPSKPREQPEPENTRSDDMFVDADEENIFISVSDRDDDQDNFKDETNHSSSMSRKERLQHMLREHRNNPKSRIICIALVVFLLFLVILIPLVTRGKNKLHIEEPLTQAPSSAPSSVATMCEDEIVLTDVGGFDLENSNMNIPCYLTNQTVHFRFKRCAAEAHPQDWVGLYPAGSMFMDRLWKDYTDGIYLCGGQPCAGGKVPPEEKVTMVPPIEDVGSYRLFLIKDSNWPFEYVQYTPSFSVVDDLTKCPGQIMSVDPPIGRDAILIDATLAPTSTSSYSWTGSTTSTSSYTSTSSSTIASSYWTSSGDVGEMPNFGDFVDNIFEDSLPDDNLFDDFIGEFLEDNLFDDNLFDDSIEEFLEDNLLEDNLFDELFEDNFGV